MRSDFLAAFVGTAIVMTAPAVASPTTFTYQGYLAQDGTPSDGAYEFEIRLLDNLGVQIGMTQTASEIVTQGQFSMQLDFGNGAFDSNERFLEISVRSVADGGAYTTLSPNQLVTSAPVAQFALSGNEGPQGPAGSQGNQGDPGTPGTTGADGADGAQGIQGFPGNDGTPGDDGGQGIQGDPGTPGDSHWSLNEFATYYNAGNVGIGTSFPFYPLHVQTSGTRAISASTNHTSGRGVYGSATAATGDTFGVWGRSSSISGRGVFGEATATTGTTNGVHGESSSTSGRGVLGHASAFTGVTYGGRFLNNSTSGRGVYGHASAATGTTYGGRFLNNSTSGRGVFGEATALTGTTYGVHGESSSTSGRGIFGAASAATGTAIGVYGQSFSTSGFAYYGRATATTGTTYGGWFQSSSTSGRGVHGFASASTGTNYGVYSRTNSPDGFAGYFSGGKNYFDGSVGVGIDAPSDKLHVSSDVGQSAFRVQQAGTTRLRVNANGGVSLGSGSTTIGADNVYVFGRLGIGDSTPDAKLDVSGDAVVSNNLTVGTTTPSSAFTLNVSGTAGKTGGGSWAVFSDERLKKNITSMTGSLDTISSLRPVNFEYKSEDHFSYLGGVQRGFIAQEVQKVIPQWVNTADDGYFYLDQVGYEALIVDAIQELRAEKDAEIETLRIEQNTKMKQLQTKKDFEIQQLEARLDRLERMIMLSVDR